MGIDVKSAVNHVLRGSATTIGEVQLKFGFEQDVISEIQELEDEKSLMDIVKKIEGYNIQLQYQ